MFICIREYKSITDFSSQNLDMVSPNFKTISSTQHFNLTLSATFCAHPRMLFSDHFHYVVDSVGGEKGLIQVFSGGMRLGYVNQYFRPPKYAISLHNKTSIRYNSVFSPFSRQFKPFQSQIEAKIEPRFRVLPFHSPKWLRASSLPAARRLQEFARILRKFSHPAWKS